MRAESVVDVQSWVAGNVDLSRVREDRFVQARGNEVGVQAVTLGDGDRPMDAVVDGCVDGCSAEEAEGRWGEAVGFQGVHFELAKVRWVVAPGAFLYARPEVLVVFGEVDIEHLGEVLSLCGACGCRGGDDGGDNFVYGFAAAKEALEEFDAVVL